ncbi:MAG: hypothetical protein ACRDQH_06630, partial [Pseudonocardiaceae bacterium]
ALVKHRHSVLSLSGPELAGHALAELAYSAALAERALSGRWVHAVDALDAGATHEQVAAATGLDVDELRTGLRSWAHNQLRAGIITTEQHTQVLTLLAKA